MSENQNTLANAALHWRKAQPSSVHPAYHDAQTWIESGRQDAENVVAKVAAHLAEPEAVSILDYGCGIGRMAVPLAERFRHVVAADTNRAFLDDKKFESRPNIQKAHIQDQEHWQTRVDVVLCHNLMIHFDWWDAGRMLGRFAEWSNALVIVLLPLYDEPVRPAGWIDVGTWTPAMFEVAAGAAGLRILEMHPSSGVFSHAQIGRNHTAYHVLAV